MLGSSQGFVCLNLYCNLCPSKKKGNCESLLSKKQNYINSIKFLVLQQYNERELVHSLPWPLSSAQPLIFNQYIYFFASVENRKTFIANPLKYLRQPKPNPCVPIKMAVVGPPKSGKTTGEMSHSVSHLSLLDFVSQYIQYIYCHRCYFFVILFFFCYSGSNVCPKVRPGTALHRQCYAHGSQHAPTHWTGRPDEIVPLPRSHSPGWALCPVSGEGVSELDLQHSRVSCASVAPCALRQRSLFFLKTQSSWLWPQVRVGWLPKHNKTGRAVGVKEPDTFGYIWAGTRNRWGAEERPCWQDEAKQVSDSDLSGTHSLSLSFLIRLTF